jgi:hypothetical protein
MKGGKESKYVVAAAAVVVARIVPVVGTGYRNWR